MRFIKLRLYSNTLDLEKKFYTEDLGFEMIDEGPNHFSIKIGWTELCFERSENKHIYHYCFLIPSNQLHAGLKWMEERTEIIEIEKGRKTQYFESWNAESFYFHDASGNLAEFIVRYNLNNEVNEDFSQTAVVGLNEIGLPTSDIIRSQNELQKLLSTAAWKGDTHRFGTHGDQEALILLPNYKVKDKWFPTEQNIQPEPFQAWIKNDGKVYHLSIENENIELTE